MRNLQALVVIIVIVAVYSWANSDAPVDHNYDPDGEPLSIHGVRLDMTIDVDFIIYRRGCPTAQTLPPGQGEEEDEDPNITRIWEWSPTRSKAERP